MCYRLYILFILDYFGVVEQGPFKDLAEGNVNHNFSAGPRENHSN